jgi:DNA polymerase III epsilon subunit-like protein
VSKFFMVDLEATGVAIGHDRVLEIGVVECVKHDGYWTPGLTYRRALHYSGQPRSQFAREHMAALYAECNVTPEIEPGLVRQDLVEFFKSCGQVGHGVILGGWNASNFDVPMLNAAGYLLAPGYVTDADGVDHQVGDHHYRIYEIGGAISVVEDALAFDRGELIKRAETLGRMRTSVPAGKDHDALYDCYKQLAILNGLIELARRGASCD